jgi:hypothetical protein
MVSGCEFVQKNRDSPIGISGDPSWVKDRFSGIRLTGRWEPVIVAEMNLWVVTRPRF